MTTTTLNKTLFDKYIFLHPVLDDTIFQSHASLVKLQIQYITYMQFSERQLTDYILNYIKNNYYTCNLLIALSLSNVLQ